MHLKSVLIAANDKKYAQLLPKKYPIIRNFFD